MTFEQIWPVLAFFLGATSTMLLDALRARRSRKDDRDKAGVARHQFFKDRRDEFELRHLIQVNEAISELTLASVTAMNERRREGMVSASSRQMVETANRQIGGVRHLILDEDLRELVRATHGALLRDGRMAWLAETYDDSDDSTADLLQEARQAIAGRVRAIYAQMAG
jgi:vacuolar-type H+-ATPase subunit D/Vma8